MMTSRERWLAALHHEPVDALPFWPKLNGSYARAHQTPSQSMSVDELHEYVGSDPQLGAGSVVTTTSRRGSIREQAEGNRHTTTWSIDGHDLTQVRQFDQGSDSWHPMSFPIKAREDIEIMTAWFMDRQVDLDPQGIAACERRLAEIDGTGMPVGHIGESPLMYVVEWLAGVEMAHYFLADCQGEMEGLFAAIHDHLKTVAEITSAHHPADLLYMVENTSTTLISPAQYRRYCFPHILDYARIAGSHDKLVALHMCGHLKLLLPDLEQLPVAAFEAFTSPTVGNTTLLDGRSQCPTKCLIGGTNAWLWTRSAEEIIRQIEHDLNQLPHHRGLVLSSAGVMPPICPPATVKAVCDWIHHYPVRN